MSRGARIAVLLQRLTARPGVLVPLSELGMGLDSAKSTLSEDLTIARRALEDSGGGRIESVPGPAGGLRYLPVYSGPQLASAVATLADVLGHADRILPGGFVFMTDVLFSPHWSRIIGECFATVFLRERADVVVTVETKGIPIALMTARALGLPLVVARRDARVTEGPSVSINYVSGSSGSIHTMSVPRRALHAGARALVIDDFMKAGGTAAGLVRLLAEVGVSPAGVGVVVSTQLPMNKRVDDYRTLLVLGHLSDQAPGIPLRVAGWIEARIEEAAPS